METARATSADNRLRLATDADVAALTQLINAAFAVEQIAIPGERIDEAGTRKYMETGEFIVLEEPSGLVGCVYVEKRDDRGYVGLLAVEPPRQGTGLARRLMAAAEEHLRKAGCHGVDLRMISAREGQLRPLYQHLGYQQTGTSPMPDAVVLKVPCHFVHMSKQLQ